MQPVPTEAVSPPATPADAGAPKRPVLRSLPHGTGPFVGLLLLCIAGVLLNPNFATLDNALNVLTRTAFIGIISVGMCFVEAMLFPYNGNVLIDHISPFYECMRVEVSPSASLQDSY